jgi:hypothetical protein
MEEPLRLNLDLMLIGIVLFLSKKMVCMYMRKILSKDEAVRLRDDCDKKHRHDCVG